MCELRPAYAADPDVLQAYRKLPSARNGAQRDRVAGNAQKWARHVEDVITPRARRGARSEAKYQEEVARERYVQEFRERFDTGVHPEDTCVFNSASGRPTFRGTCEEYYARRDTLWAQAKVDDHNALFSGLNQYADRVLGTSRRKQQGKILASASLILLQQQAQQAQDRSGSVATAGMGRAKAPSMPGVCKADRPLVSPFQSCLFLEKCTSKAPFKTCLSRAWAREKPSQPDAKAAARDRAEAHYAELSRTDHCQEEAGRLRKMLDGTYKSGPGKASSQ